MAPAAPERVLAQPGTHYSIGLLLRAALDLRPGPVVVEEPAYEPLRRIPEGLGARVLRLPRPRERDYALDLDALAGLESEAPSVLVLTHPHNPSGVTLRDEEIDAVAEFSRRTGCWVLSDEVYLEFLDDATERSLLQRMERVAIVRSFTKVFGLGGLRCTGIAAHPDWIANVIALTDHGTVALPAPTHAMAQRVWNRRHDLWDRARGAAHAGRSEVAAWLDRVGDLLATPLPEAGIICFPELKPEVHEAAVKAARGRGHDTGFGFGLDRWDSSSHLWIEDFRQLHSVQLTPGAFFENPRAFRLGYGIDAEPLREGLQRLEHYLRGVMEES